MGETPMHVSCLREDHRSGAQVFLKKRATHFLWYVVSEFWDILVDTQLALVSKDFFELFVRQCNRRHKITVTRELLPRLEALAPRLPQSNISLNLSYLGYVQQNTLRSVLQLLGPRISAIWVSASIPKPLLLSILGAATNIERLNARGAQCIDDEVLRCISAARLEKICLQGCWRITDSGLTHLLQNAPVLSDAWLRGCSKLTRLSLRAIGRTAARLTTLDFPWRERTADAAPGQLGAVETHADDPRVSAVDVQAAAELGTEFARNCPRLQLVRFSLPSKRRVLEVRAFIRHFSSAAAVERDRRRKEIERMVRNGRWSSVDSWSQRLIRFPSPLPVVEESQFTTIRYVCEGPETPSKAHVNRGHHIVKRQISPMLALAHRQSQSASIRPLETRSAVGTNIQAEAVATH